MPNLAFDADRLAREATGYLQRLIQFDTTNPPGNELACAGYIADVFAQAGIPAEVLEPAPGRGSVVARLKGNGAKRPLLLLSHLDVVPAVAADWKHAPFGGELVDGEVWGRGALDTKNLTAVWMALFLEIKRQNIALERDLVFAATADEEMGGTWGAKWLVENRPDLVDCEYALNEGGGESFVAGGRTIYLCQTAEKGICWTRLTARGTAGHASMPHDDNPVVHLAEALVKLGKTPLPVHVTETFRLFAQRTAAAVGGETGRIYSLLTDPATTEDGLARLGNDHNALRVRAMARNTAAPTVVQGSDKTNVIPQSATAVVDCRILPGQTPESLLAEVRGVLGLRGGAGDKIELALDRTSLATESAPDTALTRALEHALAKHDPEARLVPFLVPGGTDSRYLRPLGIVAYGFSPTLPDTDNASVHGINERISVKSLEFATKVLWDTVTGLVS